MSEVWFYHLERQPLERVLPQLIERSLSRGWRVVLKAESAERVEALSSLLWSYADDAFLPHGTAADGNAAEQPVWITSVDENPNRANVAIYVGGAAPGDLSGMTRSVIIFSGSDPEAVNLARSQWKSARAGGHDVSYWQQDESGRWVNRAAASA